MHDAARCRSQRPPPQPQRPRRRRSQASERRHRTPICPSRAAHARSNARRRRFVAELDGQRLARPEEQRLDRRLRRLERDRDLCVRKLLPLAQEQNEPLALGQARERLHDLDRELGRRVVGTDDLGEDARILGELDAGAAANGVDPRQAHVARDRQEPRRLGDRLDAAAERAVRLEEGLLHRILGVGRPPQAAQAIPEHARPVAAVEQLGCGCRSERSIDMFDGGHGDPPGSI